MKFCYNNNNMQYFHLLGDLIILTVNKNEIYFKVKRSLHVLSGIAAKKTEMAGQGQC